MTFSGNIADSGDAGGGIVVSGNSDGSTTFSGASKVLNTGASNAVALSSNGNPATGHEVSFTSGGLDIDTSSGQGLTSSNFGRLTVGGTGNSITTGTGVGLNVDTTRIMPGNLNFDAVSSNGATQGIRLNSTGTEGGLNVTGTGGACATTADPCSGGTIQHTTQDAVSLTSAQAITLQRMKIRNSLGNGVRGSSVTKLRACATRSSTTTATTPPPTRPGCTSRTSPVTRSSPARWWPTSPEDGGARRQLVGHAVAARRDRLDVPQHRHGVSGDLFQYIGDGTGGGDLDFTGNTLTNNEPSISTGGDGVALVQRQGAATMDVLGNTLRDSLTNALTIIKSADVAAGTNNLVANITGNSIGVAATANSGSAEGTGSRSRRSATATRRSTLRTTTSVSTTRAASVRRRSGVAGTGQFNLNISGNAVGNPGQLVGQLLLRRARSDDRRAERRTGDGGSASPINVNLGAARRRRCSAGSREHAITDVEQHHGPAPGTDDPCLRTVARPATAPARPALTDADPRGQNHTLGERAAGGHHARRLRCRAQPR